MNKKTLLRTLSLLMTVTFICIACAPILMSVSAASTNETLTTKSAQMVVIDGNKTVKYSGGKLSATELGDATVIFRLGFNLNNGEAAYVYSQPVTIHVTEASDNESDSTDTTVSTDSTMPEIPEEKTGCDSSIAPSAIFIAMAITGLGITFKKKETD